MSDIIYKQAHSANQAKISLLNLNTEQKNILNELLIKIDIADLVRLSQFKQSLLDNRVRANLIEYTENSNLEKMIMTGLTLNGKTYLTITMNLLHLMEQSIEVDKFKRSNA